MRSRSILIIHTILFTAFSIGSLSSPFIAFAYPALSPWYFIATSIVLAVLVVGSWSVFGGCPFTVWENRFSAREGRATYTGPCIDHYAKSWCGISFKGQTTTIILLILLLLPTAVGIYQLL